ncbi:MAG TPA: D-xylose ABC transporter ATP-binding protein, partial [Planctomycetaceae bacterium]|nr:D-xylose ABC transporter ATP-binding protein [Planctomycetaceae bacterium]
MTGESPILEVRQLSKRFPGVRALSEVDLNLFAGEVLAVIGENGAGKSTLMKILAGVQTQNEGKVIVDGNEVWIDSVNKALDLGISLIHQEL